MNEYKTPVFINLHDRLCAYTSDLLVIIVLSRGSPAKVHDSTLVTDRKLKKEILLFLKLASIENRIKFYEKNISKIKSGPCHI